MHRSLTAAVRTRGILKVVVSRIGAKRRPSRCDAEMNLIARSAEGKGDNPFSPFEREQERLH
jgi:hypothetical protein